MSCIDIGSPKLDTVCELNIKPYDFALILTIQKPIQCLNTTFYNFLIQRSDKHLAFHVLLSAHQTGSY